MAHEHLETYLNDHVAGSVTLVELLPALEKAYAGSELGTFFSHLRVEVTADQLDLKALMARLRISESRPRRAAAWLAERMTQLKLQLDDEEAGDLHLLESLEIISLGIEGKRCLWLALQTAAADAPHLLGTDYTMLQQRAEEQRSRVEVERLKAARIALRGA